MSGICKSDNLGGRRPPVSDHISQGTFPMSQSRIFNRLISENQVMFEKYKQSNFSYPRLTSIFPSLGMNCQKAPPTIDPPMKVFPIKELPMKVNPVKEYIDSLNAYIESIEEGLKKLQVILKVDSDLMPEGETIMQVGFNGFPF